MVKNLVSRFKAGFKSLPYHLTTMWPWVNYIIPLTSVSFSGKCKSHNSIFPLRLLWGQMTNACKEHSTWNNLSLSWLLHDTSSAVAQNNLGLCEHHVFSIICSYWEKTVDAWYDALHIGFSFFLSYFCYWLYLVTASKMIPIKPLFLYLQELR